MIKFLVLVPAFVFSTKALAADSADCDLLLNQALNNANVSAGAVDQLVSIEDGRMKINEKSKRLKSRSEEKGGRKSSLNFERVVGTPSGIATINESIDYDSTTDDHSLKYMTDKKVANMMYPAMYGQKITFHNDGSGNCSMVVSSQFIKDPAGNFAELVKSDSAFCDSVKDILKDMGKQSFNQCQGSFQKASELYDKRAKELAKTDQKFNSLGDNTLATTMEALRSCSPEEWQRSMHRPLGLGSSLGSFPFPSTKFDSKGQVRKEFKLLKKVPTKDLEKQQQ